jgi:hypothetical protein
VTVWAGHRELLAPVLLRQVLSDQGVRDAGQPEEPIRSSLETNPTTRAGLLVKLRLGLGAAGGSSVSGWFGPRTRSDVRDPGPGLVSCGDSEGTLLLEIGVTGMEWTVTNRGKDGVT